MPGLGGILNTARNALIVGQRAIETSAQNVANANTAGYTRQRVETVAGIPSRDAIGEFGGGVTLADATRARDRFLEAAFRDASGGASDAATRRDALSRIEAAIGEPSDTGVNAALDAFWGTWADLAARPTSGPARAAVQQAGQRVALQLNRVAGQLDGLGVELRSRLEDTVGTANQLASQVADLNRQIVVAEAGTGIANTLRDARDRHLDRLAGLLGTDVLERSDGSVSVLLGGLSLVDGTDARPLAVQTVSGRPVVSRASLPGVDVPLGGEAAGLRSALADALPAAMSDLDTLARGVIERTNTLHRQGVLWAGTPPVATPAGDFFAQGSGAAAGDPLRTARGMRLADAVAASPEAIAASTVSANGPSDNRTALALGQLRQTPVAFTDAGGAVVATEPPGDFLRRLATRIGLATQAAAQRAEVDDTLAQQAETRRQTVSGVSTDEELVRLIKFQQSYTAAARLVTAVNEMSRTVIDMVR